MSNLDQRKVSEAIPLAREKLDKFWSDIDKIFKSGPLSNLQSWDQIKEQSPGALKKFQNLESKISNEMTLKELDEVLKGMGECFRTLTLRYKNLNKNQILQKTQNKEQPILESDPFASDPEPVVSQASLVSFAQESEDPFA